MGDSDLDEGATPKRMIATKRPRNMPNRPRPPVEDVDISSNDDAHDDDNDDDDDDDEDFNLGGGSSEPKTKKSKHEQEDSDIDFDMDSQLEEDEKPAKRKSATPAKGKGRIKEGASARKPGKKSSKMQLDDDSDDDDFDSDEDDGDADDWRLDTKSATKANQKPAVRKARKEDAASTPKDTIVNMDDLEEPEPFVPEFDRDGFKDSADREKLMAMNEIDRESVLAERFERMQQKREEYEYKMRMFEEKVQKLTASKKKKGTDADTSTTVKRSKKAALDALAASKSRGQKSLLSELDQIPSDESDVEGAAESRRKRTAAAAKALGHKSAGPDRRGDFAHALGPPLTYEKLYKAHATGVDVSRMILTRNMLMKLAQNPIFDRAVEGALVRVSIEAGQYRVMRIRAVKHRGYSKRYKFGKIHTDAFIITEPDLKPTGFELSFVSDGKITYAEFEVFRAQLSNDQMLLPTEKDEENVSKRVSAALAGTLAPTDEEINQHRESFELLNPETLNIVQKKIDLEYLIERLGKDPDANAKELLKTKKLLGVILEFEKRNTEKVSRGQVDVKHNQSRNVLREIHSKNLRESAAFEKMVFKKRLEDSKISSDPNASDDKFVRSTSGGGVNPFARMEATGASYWSIKKAKEEGVLVKGEPQPSLTSIASDRTNQVSIERVVKPRFKLDLNLLANTEPPAEPPVVTRKWIIPNVDARSLYRQVSESDAHQLNGYAATDAQGRIIIHLDEYRS